MTKSTSQRIEMYRLMYLCRHLEATCCRLNPRWFPAEGEEATIVGAFYGLRPDDFISPHYRGPFTAYLLKGALMEKLIGQALAKSTGYSRGRSVAFTGPAGANAAPWVSGDLGTSLSVAVGAALSFSMDREGGNGAADRVSLVTFGDGTANRGDFHEAVNLAAVWKLPVVFVCQNNCYAISQHVSSYIAGSSIAARAAGYGMPGVAIDGNDVLGVHEAVQAAVTRARAGDGPSLVEAQTYRLGGHWAEDPGRYRSPEEVTEWRERDPLPLHSRRLIRAGVGEDELRSLERGVATEIEAAVAAARQAPDPGQADLGIGETLAP